MSEETDSRASQMSDLRGSIGGGNNPIVTNNRASNGIVGTTGVPLLRGGRHRESIQSNVDCPQ